MIGTYKGKKVYESKEPKETEDSIHVTPETLWTELINDNNFRLLIWMYIWLQMAIMDVVILD